MDPRLLQHYNRELQHVREMGGEFAAAFPKIAGRLGLDGFECADPYVERLLEAFAFMAARVQLRMDAEFPRFTNNLLEMVYPHYLAPTPSMLIAELQPAHGEGALASGFVVPAGSLMRSRASRDEPTPCRYRTAHDVVLWPLELVEAEYSGFVGALAGLRDNALRGARAVLRLKLRATSGLKLSTLSKLDRLPIHIRVGGEATMRLYQNVLVDAKAVVVAPAGAPPASREVLPADSVRPLGFGDEHALIPYGARSFQGYRLLQEYFAFPARFLFFELTGLAGALARCDGSEVELQIVLGQRDATLEGNIDRGKLALYCTPAINLFPHRADRIHLNDREHEYHVVPDRTRPMDYEVHAVTEVVGYGTSATQKRPFQPLYASNELRGAETSPAFYVASRRPRMLSSKQRTQGARSSYVGSELFLSLVDGNEGPFHPDLKQLAVETVCTNRDLPLHMPIGQGVTDFTLETGAPVQAIRCVAGPSAPRASHAHGDASWRLISHLSLNYLSITNSDDTQGAAMLRELLRLYADVSDGAIRKQIDGVRFIQSQPITRRLPVAGPAVFGRGVEVQLTLDEAAFEGSGGYLLGAVLARFFARHVSINSFTETVLGTVQRGEIARWPIQMGVRPSL